MLLLVSGATATIRRLRDVHPNHLGHLLTPRGGNVDSVFGTGLPWAADNDCFNRLDPVAFRRMLTVIRGRTRCLFVTCPDVVANAVATLDRFREWSEEIRSTGQPIAFVGQDGAEDCELPWSEFDAWFVGGSDAWKLCRASWELMAEAKRRGKWVHVGRVNSFRRLMWCHDHGADSADGSSMSKFSDHYINRFCWFVRGLEQQPVWWE